MSEARDKRDPRAEDAEMEAVVLRRVLDLHPSQVSCEELVREVAADPEDFGQRDSVVRAARELTGVGLLHRNGEFVFPTLAALRFAELLGASP